MIGNSHRNSPFLLLSAYNFRLVLKCWYYSFFKSRGTVGRMTPNRWKKFLFSHLILYIPPFLLGIISSALDHFFFPGYRTQEVRRPLFIIGNFRSGSTLLHRLLAQDSLNFLAIKPWEFFYAPSIIQRRWYRNYLALEKYFGSPLLHLCAWLERKYMAPVKIHPIGWRIPDEDECSLLYIFSSFIHYFIFPFEDLFEPYFYFDQKLDLSTKDRILGYYRDVVQRHLYANHVGNRHFLSKNPGFSPKIEALFRHFPDARFIYMVRDPVESLPSALKLISIAFRLFNDPPEEYPQKDFFIKIFKHWYLHPLQELPKIPAGQWMILRYDRLSEDLEGTVRDIYAHFDLPLEDTFLQIVREAAEHSKTYQSTTLGERERQGFTKEQIREEFAEVIERFGF